MSKVMHRIIPQWHMPFGVWVNNEALIVAGAIGNRWNLFTDMSRNVYEIKIKHSKNTIFVPKNQGDLSQKFSWEKY